MTRLPRPIEDFLDGVPHQDKADVLITNQDLLPALQKSGYAVAVVQNQSQLTGLIDHIQRAIRAHMFDHLFSAFLHVSRSLVVPDGAPPNSSYPVIPTLGSSPYAWKQVLYLERDSLSVDSLSMFFGRIARVSALKRPKIFFKTEKLEQGEIDEFKDFQDLINLYRAIPSALLLTEFSQSSERARRDYAKYFIDGSMVAAAEQILKPPPHNAYLEEKRQYVVNCHAKIVALQSLSESFSAEASSISKELLSYIRHQRALYPAQDPFFFRNAYTFVQLGTILIDDDARDAATDALAFSAEIQDDFLNGVAGRYANQVSGVSAYSLEMLGRAHNLLKKNASKSQYACLVDMQLHAVQQNIFITRLFSENRALVDPSEAYDYAQFVEQDMPSYQELAMLKNSAALSFLLKGRKHKALSILDQCIYDNGATLSILNFRINRLIAQFVSSGRVDEAEVVRVLEGFLKMPFPPQTGYHPTMALGNLLAVTAEPDIKRLIIEVLMKKKYMNYTLDILEGGHLIAYLRQTGFLFMNEQSFRGSMGRFIDDYGLMPAFEFNWSTPPAG